LFCKYDIYIYIYIHTHTYTHTHTHTYTYTSEYVFELQSFFNLPTANNNAK